MLRLQKVFCRHKIFWGSTSGLKRHLKNKHNIVDPSQRKEDASLAEAGSASSSGHGTKRPEIDIISSQKQEKITKYTSKISCVQEEVAKMVAVDGFSANQNAKRNFIKEAF